MRKATMQFSVKGGNYHDFYTITKTGFNRYSVSRKGSGDNETYEANTKEVERLQSLATSEII